MENNEYTPLPGIESIQNPSFITSKSKPFASAQVDGETHEYLEANEKDDVILTPLEAENVQMKTVLRKLIEAFPEMDTDEPIDGSDAVNVLCQMWDEIKEAAN